jgi:glycosyltransferase involved in cell wall biosynthesis
MNKLIIVVPTKNEAEVFRETNSVLAKKIESLISNAKIAPGSGLVYVDDGSSDNTWQQISAAAKEKASLLTGIKLSHNFGHQNALIAGIEYASENKADYVITIDADLQDDPDAIDEMIDLANEGVDIVYGVRSDRKSDTFFKRFFAESFYKIMNWMGVDTVFNHADFRLIDRRVMDALSEFPEREIFLRGIFPSMGFKTDKVFYARSKRTAGKTKYPIFKQISFALDGITSFSIVPIRLIRNFGMIVVAVSVLFLIWTIVESLQGKGIPGWPSLIVSIWALSGVILFSLGVIGEYIGRIYVEVKKRPRYLIEQTTEKLKDDKDN